MTPENHTFSGVICSTPPDKTVRDNQPLYCFQNALINKYRASTLPAKATLQKRDPVNLNQSTLRIGGLGKTDFTK